MNILNGVTWYYDNFGLRGLWAISSYRLVGRPQEFTAQTAGVRKPVHIRIKTTDESAYSQVLRKREYALDLPFSPKVIIDAGANIGMASIYFANRYPEAKIISIEAEASNFAVLARNVRPYPAIIPVHAALWNRDGEINVGGPDPASGPCDKWSFVTREGAGARVRAITMETLMREMGVAVVDIAKIDIEGAEAEVFADTRWVSAIQCLMIELHEDIRPGCSELVEQGMQDFRRSDRGETVFFVREKPAEKLS
jgi:FkbM family methyltransferase